jgi:hypothetical protein
MPRKKSPIAKQYPKSKLVNKCLLKVTARMKQKPAVCEHDKIGYEDLMYLLKQSQKVVANLAKTLASMEEKFDDAKETVEFVTESATKQLKMKTDQLNLKDDQISFLRSTLIREGVKIDETQQ